VDVQSMITLSGPAGSGQGWMPARARHPARRATFSVKGRAMGAIDSLFT
jgi:hypothetical protein